MRVNSTASSTVGLKRASNGHIALLQVQLLVNEVAKATTRIGDLTMPEEVIRTVIEEAVVVAAVAVGTTTIAIIAGEGGLETTEEEVAVVGTGGVEQEGKEVTRALTMLGRAVADIRGEIQATTTTCRPGLEVTMRRFRLSGAVLMQDCLMGSRYPLLFRGVVGSDGEGLALHWCSAPVCYVRPAAFCD